MIAITSISPKHHNQEIQKTAVESWKKQGFDVVSMNSHVECELLKNQYPEVEFVPTFRTMQGLYKRPYVGLNAIFDYAKEEDIPVILLINSDIILTGDLSKEVGQSEHGVFYAHRNDFDSFNQEGFPAHGKKYIHGFDAFLIHKRYYDVFPQSVYCLGQTWWDYWVPFKLLQAGVDLYEITENLFWHKTHPVQYDVNEWRKMTQYFEWENEPRISTRPQQTTFKIHTYIKKNTKSLYS